MSNDLNLHFHLPNGGGDLLPLIVNQLRKLLMNQQELATALEGVSTKLGEVGTQLEKATNEITVAVSNAGMTSPAVDSAVAKLQAVADSLKTASQALDDINPDAPA